MNPNTERDERVATFKDWLKREDSGDVEQLERCWNRAATRMRDLCVARVRECKEQWLRNKQFFGAGNPVAENQFGLMVGAANEILTALESLTLEQGEQEKSK